MWNRNLFTQKKLKLTQLLLISMVLIFSSCLNVQKINIFLYLDENNFLSGKARIEFINISSTEDSEEKQRKELAALQQSYKTDATHLIRMMGLYDENVQLKNFTGLGTDAVIEGSFSNFAAAISGILIKDGILKIETNKKEITVNWQSRMKEKSEFNLILVYRGKIISHNSKHFDAKTKTLRWRLDTGFDKEIRFTLGEN